jgi:hypothetical protein
MFIYRKAADKNYRPEDLSPEEQHVAEIHIAKHRNGPTGMVKLFFDGASASFRNLQKQDMGMPGLSSGIKPAALQAPGGIPAAMANQNPF